MSSIFSELSDSSVVFVESFVGSQATSVLVYNIYQSNQNQDQLILIDTESKDHFLQSYSQKDLKIDNEFDIEQIYKKVKNLLETTNKNSTVIIYPLTPFIWFNNDHLIEKLLLTLKTNRLVTKTIFVCIGDSHSSEKLQPLRNLANSVVELSYNPNQFLDCKIKNWPTIAKLDTSNHILNINVNTGEINSITIKEVVKPVVVKKAEPKQDNEDQVLKNLTTFNLGLSQKEKEAKEKVVLPFWTEEQKKALAKLTNDEEESVRIHKKALESAKIYYEPDEADDWDEEDPDDDLDF